MPTESEANIQFSSAPIWSPGAKIVFNLNNPTNVDANNFVIDLSGLSTQLPDLYNEIDWSSVQGGIYNAEKHTITVANIGSGSSHKVSFGLPVSAKDILADSITQQTLAANNGLIITKGANTNSTSSPMVVVAEPVQPINATLNMTTNAVLTLKALDTMEGSIENIQVASDLPQGISAQVSCDGLSAGQECAISFTADATAQALNNQTIDISYQLNGATFITQAKLSVDNTTVLANNGTNSIQRKNVGSGDRTSRITITNTGKFNIIMPADLNQLFSLSSSGQINGLEISGGSCVSATLAPDQQCTVEIKSTEANINTPLNVTLATKSYSNINAQNIAVLELVDSPDGFSTTVNNPLPNQAAQIILYEAKITNDDATDETIKSITLPQIDGITFTPTQRNTCTQGALLNGLGSSCIISYEVSADAGKLLTGNLAIELESDTQPTVTTLWKSSDFNTSFVTQGELPQALVSQDNPTVAPNSQLVFNIKNNTNQPMQLVNLNFAAMPDELRAIFNLDTATGVYDPATQTLTYADALLAQDTHTFTISIKADAEAMLKKYYNELNNNTSTGYIKLGALNSKSSNPNISVDTMPVELNVSELTLNSTGSQTIQITNQTNATFSYTVSTDATGVMVTPASGSIAANQETSLFVTAAADAPLQTNKTITLTINDGSTTYVQQILVSTVAVSLEKANNNNITVARQYAQGANATITNVQLKNIGGFNVQANNLEDLFEIVNTNGQPVSGLSIVAPTSGSSCLGVAPDSICAVGIQSTSTDTQLGNIYTLKLKKDPATNIQAAKDLSTFELVEGSPSYGFDVYSLLPSQVLVGHDAVYDAVYTNTADQAVTFTGVDLPSTEGVTYGTDEYSCWDGTNGATVNPGQICYLSFILNQPQPANFIGDLAMSLSIPSGETFVATQHDLFNTQVVESENLTDKTTVNDGLFEFSPGHLATLQIISPNGQPVNFMQVNTTNMPQAVKDAISTIVIDGTGGYTLEDLNSGVPLGQGTHELSIDFNADSGAVLEQYQNELMSNSLDYPVFVVSGTNLPAYAPSIQVNSQLLDIPSPTAEIAIYSVFPITNTSTQPVIIGAISGSKDGFTLDSSDCQDKTLQTTQHCNIIYHVTNQAYGTAVYTLSFSGSDGESLTQDFSLTAAPVLVTMQVPTQITEPSQAGEVATQPITITNKGGFALKLKAGHTWVDDALSLDPTLSGVTLDGSSATPCSGTLLAYQSCTVNLQVTNPADNGQTQLNINKDAFENLAQSETSGLITIAGTLPQIDYKIINSEGNWETVSNVTLINPSTEPATPFTDNGDGTITETGANLMWIQDANTINGGNTLIWQTAIDTCAAMATGGFNDWRLPTGDELLGVVILKQAETGDYNNIGTWLNQQGFLDIQDNYYWTSMEITETIAAMVDFDAGTINSDDKTNGTLSRAWCVRSS